MKNNKSNLHRLSNRILPKALSNKKTEHNSLYLGKSCETRDAQRSIALNKNKMPVLKPQGQRVIIYLLYQDMKISVKVEKGLPFSELVPMLYLEIAKAEINRNLHVHTSKQTVSKQCQKVLGFSTVSRNLKTDYLLSILEGKVQKSLLLECFYLRKGSTRSRKHKISKSEKSKQNLCASDGLSQKFNYEIYNCLATGGFSKVYLARSCEDGQFYAIKFIRKKKQKYEQNRMSVLNEMQISLSIEHPFLINMKEGFETTQFYCMVFQYCPGGQLFYLLKRVKLFNEATAKFYFLQVLMGIKYLHEKSIIYRDLKPQNILIDRQGNLKIVDFGLSKKVQSNKTKTYSYCGSAEYMAPQMILRSGHSVSIDYYSLGALLYELVTGLPPFYSKNPAELHESILIEELRFPNNSELSFELKDFLIRLLNKDQKMRLGSYAGIKEILFHPWIGKVKMNEIFDKTASVPYPPDLSEHNFDMDELGQDEKQFTAQVHRQFYSKNLSQIKFQVRRANKIIRHPYSQIITQVVNKACDSQQRKCSPQILQQRDQKMKTQSIQRNLDKNKPNLSQTITYDAHSSNRRSPLKQLTIRDTNRSFEREQRCYQKLFPYFNKAKLCRPQNNKKGVPRANILKMKINETRNQQQQNSTL